jgi:hypothetical protein
MLKLLLAGLFAIVSLLPQAVRSAGVKADWQSEWEKTFKKEDRWISNQYKSSLKR